MKLSTDMQNNRLFYCLLLMIVTTITAAQGTIERIKVFGKSLEGNLSGDSATRDVSVYLPPSYVEGSQNYPVVYMLHGFTDNDSKWFGHEEHWIDLPHLVDKAIVEGQSKELIVVMPNAYNRFKGSMYSSSITIGDWESFISEDLVHHIDQRYRTIPELGSRGLAGHSMGGYGAIRLGMKRPDVFSSIYLLSPCCMDSNVNPNPGLRRNVAAVQVVDQLEEQPFFVIATLAASAAWAPNPTKPPFYLDLPFDGEEDQPAVVAKFHANATLSMLDQYIPNLRRLRAIRFDVGNQDWGINGATKRLHDALSKYGIEHNYESYDGDHINGVGKRISTKLLPFFSKHLDFQ
ncbi:MAG: esterase family protein [Saprospiraceae bacterium]|nr:esterase family protein [Saprospiraceae bacterium]